MIYLFLLALAGIHLGCVWLLWLSLWPGLAESVLVTALVLGVIGLVYGVPVILLCYGLYYWLYRRVYYRRKHPLLFKAEMEMNAAVQQSPYHRRLRRWLKTSCLTAIALIFLTSILIKLELPRTFAFRLARPAFEAELARLPLQENPTQDNSPQDPPQENWSSSNGKRFGLYWVPEYHVLAEGGTYFKTGDHGFIWAYTYGFVYQPHPYDSPFGTSPYNYHPVVDDWYWFEAGQEWL